jgi:hypothetical protein
MGDFQQREPTTKLRGRLGRPSSYGALLQEAGGRYDGQATPVRFAERHGAAQTALDRLAAEIRAARFDALVVFGDGQKELFHEDNLPALMVHTGGAISHRMRPPKPEWVEWFAQMQSRYHPVDDSWQHPVEIPLANHLVEALVDAHFDPAVCERLPRDEGMGHAFAFVHQRLFGWQRPSFFDRAEGHVDRERIAGGFSGQFRRTSERPAAPSKRAHLHPSCARLAPLIAVSDGEPLDSARLLVRRNNLQEARQGEMRALLWSQARFHARTARHLPGELRDAFAPCFVSTGVRGADCFL